MNAVAFNRVVDRCLSCSKISTDAKTLFLLLSEKVVPLRIVTIIIPIMREVFISYKSNDPELGNNDGTVAKELCEALEAAGISCWIAPRDIEPGKRYGLAIMEAIKSCKVMLVVFSRYANESEHIATEVEKAFTRRIDIIPFNIDGTSPGLEMEYYLGRPQWIDAADDYHKGIPALIAALRHKLGERDNNDQAMKLETPIDSSFFNFYGQRITV